MAFATIAGHVGSDPTLRETREGKPWVSLSVAWSERQKDRTGRWDNGPTVWVSVRVYGRQAEHIAASVKKGTHVVASGDLQPESWSADHGEQTVLAMNAKHVAVGLHTQVVQVDKPVVRRGEDLWNTAEPSGGFSADGGDEQPPF